MARALQRYIDDIKAFRNVFAAVMGSKALVELRKETGGELARYTTLEMLKIKHAMAARADLMSRHSYSQSGSHASRNGSGHGVDRHHVDQELRLQDEAIRAMTEGPISQKVEQGNAVSSTGAPQPTAPAGLSEEQWLAIRHVSGDYQGSWADRRCHRLADAGKSRVLAAAHTAWAAPSIAPSATEIVRLFCAQIATYRAKMLRCTKC